jgi:molybdopterin synthase catalytic subunit
VTFLTEAEIDTARLAARVTGVGRGAQVSFVGTVRNHQDGREVSELHYTAYGPMAEAQCRTIVDEAEARWPVSVVLRHRVGTLAIGDAAVVVVAAGDHREEAFAACRFVMEEVKRRVPIWKHERYADGTEAWVDPTAAADPAETGSP